MNKAEAKATFAKELKFDCTHEGCSAKKGELCDTPAVWVHLERIFEAYPEMKGSDKDG